MNIIDEILRTTGLVPLPILPGCYVDHQWTFGWALMMLNHGGRVARKGWNGRGMWLRLVEPSPTSDMTLPYIMISTADGEHVPWHPSQVDLLAEDWEGVEQ